MSKTQVFFWRCAGADLALLKKSPSESSKYVGIGASVLFTGLFAALAAGYALYTVFDSVWPALLFGLLWGLMIFNLDRYIVSSMRKKGRAFAEFKMAFPRIVLAVIISLVIAKPLELKIFEKEIESELGVMQQEDLSRKEAIVKERFTAENQQLNAEITTLRQAITEKEARRDELRRIAQQEADGTGGSGRRNAGPIYQIKKADAERADAELTELKERNQALISQKLAQLQENDSLSQASLQALELASLNGLASRLEAMDRLVSKSEAIRLAQWFILLLFIAVETAPIFVKLMAGRGPYDYLQQSLEYGFQAEYYQNMARTNARIKAETEELPEEESTYLEEKLRLGLDKS